MFLLPGIKDRLAMECIATSVIHMNTEEASIIPTFKSLVSDQTQKKNLFSHSGLHKSQIISYKQSTITLEPF